jgi:DnaJ family protein C protein 2
MPVRRAETRDDKSKPFFFLSFFYLFPAPTKLRKEFAGLAFEQLVCHVRGIQSTPHLLAKLNQPKVSPATTSKKDKSNSAAAAASSAKANNSKSKSSSGLKSYEDIDGDDDAADGDNDDDADNDDANDNDVESAEDAAMREKLRQKKLGAHLHFQTNLYELLGIGELGEHASQADIKKAYRAMVLQYHPDKNTAIDDDIFKKIQDAYDTLSDEEKRRDYDSTIPFDDSLPPASLDAAEDFFKLFAPAFRRNAKWSSVQPVPELGEANTPIAKVLKFYDFWESFKSWRSWPHLNEFDVNTADGREERRWMERRNDATQSKKKKAEKMRINELITRARRNDPRIAAYNAGGAERSKRQKEEAARQRREAQKQARAQDLARRADITPVGPATPAAPVAAAAAAAEPEAVVVAAPAGDESEKPWSADELVALAKAVAKFPPGARNRWEQMQPMLPSRSVKEIIARTKQIAAESDARRLADRGIAVPDAFSSSQAKAKAKTTAAAQRSDRNDKALQDESKVTVVSASAAAAAAPAAAAAAPPAAAADAASGDDWTPAQQQLLEEALKLFPGPGKERWTGIAQHTGRSRKDCVERFKVCVNLLSTNTSNK